jgi:hypothetical protein
MKRPISHKRINQLIFVILLISGSIYYFNRSVNTQEKCEETGNIWHEDQQTCEQSLPQFIFNKLAGNHPISLHYPNSDRQIELNKTEQIGKLHYLVGHYERVLREKSEKQAALYDRGSIYLNMSKMIMLTEDRSKPLYFSAPFVMQTAGSGVFVYVGLFSFDNATGKAAHLDSVLLGDRIRDENIFFIKDFIQVDYNDYAEGQAMSEQPREAKSISLRLIDLSVSGKTAHFEKAQRMHHSWDTDKDGVNDCEKEGSCDHTLDYSQPKP